MVRIKELAVLIKLGQAIPKELPVVDLVCPRLENHAMTGSGANVAK